MQFRWLPLLSILAVAAGPVAGAQTPAPQPVLTLPDAIALARTNNPDYLQTRNNLRPAAAAVRSADMAFLPSVDASFDNQYRQGGQQLFNGASLGASSDIIQSSYSLDLSMRLNSATLINPRLQRASRDAVEADIYGAGETLRAEVTRQYLTVLQASANAELSDTLVRTAEIQLAAAQARAAAGAATALDVRRAEVTLGQAQVDAITARNTVEVEKLRLFQQIGVPQPADVQLTTQFTVAAPSFGLDSVLGLARRQNPGLEALRAREKVAGLGYRRAQGEYSPTLTLATGWGGYTYEYTDADYPVEAARQNMLGQAASCAYQDSIRTALWGTGLDCSGYVLTPQMESQIRSQNNQYPFNFTKSPWSFVARLSFPIFDNLGRELRVQQAAADRDDAKQRVRAQELALTANVTGAYLTLTTAARTVGLREQNAVKAREELTLVQERYRVGAAPG